MGNNNKQQQQQQQQQRKRVVLTVAFQQRRHDHQKRGDGQHVGHLSTTKKHGQAAGSRGSRKRSMVNESLSKKEAWSMNQGQ